MINNKKSRIEELVSNDEFISQILLANNGDDVKQLFKNYGIDVSTEEIEKLRANFLEQLDKSQPISDEKLKQMSGGLDFSRTGYACVSGMADGGQCGMWLGATLGACTGLAAASVKAARAGEIKENMWSVAIKKALKTSIKTSILCGVAGAALGGAGAALEDVSSQTSDKLNDIKYNHMFKH